MKKSELIHHRLQAMLREHTFHDLEYLGERKSYKSGEMEHWYNIGGNEVPVDAIMELESAEP
tara:strand:- start:1942 stop:2127 length:186 start_codon:yes stop_codon:yes gene_type:complete